MEIEHIKQEIKTIFVERLNINVAKSNLDDDAGLFADDGWAIDSVDVIDLVLGIEKTFGIRLEQDAEVQRHFKSLNTLAAYLQTRRAETVSS